MGEEISFKKGAVVLNITKEAVSHTEIFWGTRFQKTRSRCEPAGAAERTVGREGPLRSHPGWPPASWGMFFHSSSEPGVAQNTAQNGQLIFTVSLLLFPRCSVFKTSRTPGSFHCPENVPVLGPPFLPLPCSKSGNRSPVQMKVISIHSQLSGTAKQCHLIQMSSFERRQGWLLYQKLSRTAGETEVADQFHCEHRFQKINLGLRRNILRG